MPADVSILVLKLKSKKYNADMKKSVDVTKKLEKAQLSLDKSGKKTQNRIKSLTSSNKKLAKSFDAITSKAKKSKKALGSFGRTSRRVNRTSGGMSGLFGGNFNVLSRGLLGVSGSFIAMAGAVGVAVVALRKFMSLTGNAIKLSNIQELAEAKLAGVLKTSGNALRFTNRELKNYAFQMSNATSIADELIINMQGVLATFTEVRGANFKNATKRILDLSKVMDQGLKQSAIQVGKALNDPIKGLRGLRRVGVFFNKTQTTLIRNFVAVNNVAAAQRVILGRLNDEFGNTARLMSDTTSGRIDKMANSFNNISESIGTVLKELPLMNSGFAFMNKTLLQTSIVLKNVAEGFKLLPTGGKIKELGRALLAFQTLGLSNLVLANQSLTQLEKQKIHDAANRVAGGKTTGQAFNPFDVSKIPTFAPSKLVGGARAGSVEAARVQKLSGQRIESMIETNTRRTAQATERLADKDKVQHKPARDPILATPAPFNTAEELLLGGAHATIGGV